VIGNVDAISGLELVYPEAIYLHEGETWFVRELDLKQKVAYVEPRTVDYYTQPVLDTGIRVRGEVRRRSWRGETVTLNELTYSWQTVAMKKIRFHSLDAIGYHPLELPRLTLETVGFALGPGEAAWSAVVRRGLNPVEGLQGVRNLFNTLLSMLAMCDPADLQGKIDSSNTGRPTLYVFDRYPGGLGFAEQGYARLDELSRRRSRTSKPASARTAARRASACRRCGRRNSRIPTRARARDPGQGGGARPAPPLALPAGGRAVIGENGLRRRLGELVRVRRSGDSVAPRPAERVAVEQATLGVEAFLPGGEWRDGRGAVWVHERLRSDWSARARLGALGEAPETSRT
jgi:hypothetical protein